MRHLVAETPPGQSKTGYQISLPYPVQTARNCRMWCRRCGRTQSLLLALLFWPWPAPYGPASKYRLHTHSLAVRTTCNSAEVTCMLHTAAVNLINACPPGHVRAPERVPRGRFRLAAGGLTVPVDHHKLIACSSGLCVTAERVGQPAAWPAPRPRFTCGLGFSCSSHVSCEGPHRSGPWPQYLVLYIQ